MHLASLETMIDVIEDGLRLKLEIQTIRENFLKLLSEPMESPHHSSSTSVMNIRNDNLSIARSQIKALYDARKLRSRPRKVEVLNKVNNLLNNNKTPFVSSADENNKENNPLYGRGTIERNYSKNTSLKIDQNFEKKTLNQNLVRKDKYRKPYHRSVRPVDKISTTPKAKLANETSIWTVTSDSPAPKHTNSPHISSKTHEKDLCSVQHKDISHFINKSTIHDYNPNENIKNISQITEASFYHKPMREQASTANINESLIFHSTFNYPLHSTLNNPFDCTILSEDDENTPTCDKADNFEDSSQTNKTIKANLEETNLEKKICNTPKNMSIGTSTSHKSSHKSSEQSCPHLNNLSAASHANQRDIRVINHCQNHLNILNKLRRQTGQSNLKKDEIRLPANLSESDCLDITHNFTKILCEYQNEMNSKVGVSEESSRDRLSAQIKKTISDYNQMQSYQELSECKWKKSNCVDNMCKNSCLNPTQEIYCYKNPSSLQNRYPTRSIISSKTDENKLSTIRKHNYLNLNSNTNSTKSSGNKHMDARKQISLRQNKKIKGKLKKFISNFTDDHSSNCISFQTLAQI